MSGRRRVVVTGVGAATPLALSAEGSWDGIREQRLGYAMHRPNDKRIKARFFGRLPEGSAERLRVPRSLRRQIPLFAQYALHAADEAMGRAFPREPWDRTYSRFRAGAVVGTGWGGLDEANLHNNEYRDSGALSPFATIRSMNHAASAAVAMRFGLRGPQLAPAAACAAGAAAVGEAAEMIRSGRADLVVAGGGESLMEDFNVLSVDFMGALSKEQADPARASCPFDLHRSGFVLSEGAAVLVLEDHDAARRRGAEMLGEVTGYGSTTDAYDLAAPAPDGLARVGAICAALDQAGIRPEDVDYVNAHGTSTPLNDLDESDAIKAALGGHARAVPVSSTKSYTGHLIGAAGALEAVFCLLAIRDGLIPATIHLRTPDPACDLDYVPHVHRLAPIRRVLKLSFGFGGANAVLVLEDVRP